MTDQDPEDEMDTQPVTENLSDTQELTGKDTTSRSHHQQLTHGL